MTEDFDGNPNHAARSSSLQGLGNNFTGSLIAKVPVHDPASQLFNQSSPSRSMARVKRSKVAVHSPFISWLGQGLKLQHKRPVPLVKPIQRVDQGRSRNHCCIWNNNSTINLGRLKSRTASWRFYPMSTDKESLLSGLTELPH